MDTAILPHAESYAFFSPWAEKIGWKNEVTIRRHVAKVAWQYHTDDKAQSRRSKELLPRRPNSQDRTHAVVDAGA